MFDHSVKVPRLYKTASKIAKEVSEGKGSIKQLVYECKHPNIKGLYALVVHVFQKTDDIENLLKKSKLLVKEPRFDPWLAKILITELLWGKKRLTGESKPVKTILAYEQIFKAHLSDVSLDLEDSKQVSVEKPRYVRVNTLKITTNEAVEGFRDEGWILKRYPKDDYLGFLDAVTNLGSEEFMVDIHVPNLLIFPPKTQFYQHRAYKNGSILLQDKASCLPVHILNPERGATILDMCAAPGMKTTQTAAMIENDGLIYAVEIGTKRFNTLNKIVESSGATCVKTINRDVLTITNTDCPDVEYILVDPSCSGSGITDRIEIGQQKWDEHQERLGKLAGFQITTLRYALTKFPKAKRVVYSTCSVYPEENEDVVRQVLETCMGYKLVPAAQFVKNSWINFGSSDFGDIGKFCLYAKPDIDQTSGFFVAVFEKLGKNESNQFLNSNMFLYGKRIERKRKYLQSVLDEGESEAPIKQEINDQGNDEGVALKIEKKRKKQTSEDDIKNWDGEQDLIPKIKEEKEKEGLPEDETALLQETVDVNKRKKKKKKKDTEKEIELLEETLTAHESKKEKKKKKKKKDTENESELAEETIDESKIKKKNKKKKDTDNESELLEETIDESKIKKKKNKRKDIDNESELPEETIDEFKIKKKKKKRDDVSCQKK